MSLLVGFVIIIILIRIAFLINELDLDFETPFDIKRHLNYAYTCKNCGITSREYQIKDKICPHCQKLYPGLESVDDDLKYPFAPKIGVFKALQINRKQQKKKRITEDLSDLERIDKEIQSYENLQLAKLADYEKKADEIKKELKEYATLKHSK